MKNKTLKNLIALASFAIFFVCANSALAYVPGVYEPQRTYNNTGAAFTELPTVYSTYQYTSTANQANYTNTQNNQPTYLPSATNTNYVPTSTNTVRQNTTTGYTNNYVAPTPVNYNNTSSVNSNSNVDRYNDGLTAAAYDSQNAGSQITALALNGSGGFMPSSVWQWIIVVFLILIIIIIIRVMMKKPVTVHHEQHMAPSH